MGRKEDNIKRAQALMHKPEYIRNIGTAAHIDHGKCLSGNARLWLDGEWVRAEDLWARWRDGPSVPNSHQAELRAVTDGPLWTRSIDPATGDPAFAQITHVWRLPATEPLVEIETRDGRRIRTTPEHKYVAATGHSLGFREARNLRPRDILAVPRWLPSGDDSRDWDELEAVIIRRLTSDSRFLLELSSEGEESLGLAGLVRGPVLSKAACQREIPLQRVYAWAAHVTYRLPKWRGAKSATQMRLPSRDQMERIFRYFGLLYGDGDGNGYLHGADEDLLGEALETLRLIVPRPALTHYPPRVPRVESRSKTLLMFLHVVLGYPLARKARSMRLPDILYRAPLPIVTAFLQGYMDADGTVEKGRSAVSMTSASQGFLDDLQLLLLRLGVRGILERGEGNSTLYISGRTNLKRLPKFGDVEKRTAQEVLEAKAGTSYVVDVVPVTWANLEGQTWKSRMYAKLGQRASAASLLSMVSTDLLAVEPVLNPEVAFVEIRATREVKEDWVYDFSVPGLRNFVAEGFFVHNTTLSDNLIAGAGMMSEELAGKQLMLDFDEQEQARGITINAAIASMVHQIEGHEYLINLIDTPGHVDFGGDVTRAMRAIDGVILVVDAVEGVMPQTETVIRQAMKEKVKPVLFINKVDRLINELKLTPEQMQQRFVKIITDVDARIRKLLPDELKEKWSLSVEKGNVTFGSAFNNWAISVPFMQRSGIKFPDIYRYLQEGKQKELAKLAPLHKVVLDMVIHHHPNPLEAQKNRVPVIWKGDLESRVGKAMMEVDERGPVAFMVTKIIIDPHAGEVAAGRLFSGKVARGQELWISGMPNPNRTQTVALVVGADRIPVEEIDAGNVVAVVGLKDAIAGSTVSSDKEMAPFERIVHYSDPVITVAIEAKHTKDLPKLVEVLRTIAKADPSIQVEINQETGEHLMAGMGELHLEITQYRIVHDHGVEITASTPIVVYRENVAGKGGPFEGKSPNKHNRFYMEVEPLPQSVVEAIRKGDIPSGQRIKDPRALAKQLQELGFGKDEAKSVEWIHGNNMLIDATKGIQYLHETMELIKEAFIEAMDKGPLANEKCMGVKVLLVDAKLHEDAVHRGPAQVIPAARSAIYGAMCLGDRIMLEPLQKVVLNLPQDVMGAAISELQGRRCVIEDIQQEGENATITSRAPVAEMFGFATAIRSATQGRVLWSYENAGFERVPPNLLTKVVADIRTRKGLKPEPYDAAYYAG